MDMDGLGTFARVEEQSVRSDAARPYSGDILSGICTLTPFSRVDELMSFSVVRFVKLLHTDRVLRFPSFLDQPHRTDDAFRNWLPQEAVLSGERGGDLNDFIVEVVVN
jgi:hypothetical protein